MAKYLFLPNIDEEINIEGIRKRLDGKNVNTCEWWNNEYKTRGGGERNEPHRFRPMLDFVLPGPAIDIGCCFGHLPNLLYKKGCWPVWGVDISTKAMQLAKRNYPRVNFRVGDANRLPFKNDSFRTVCSTEALEHLDDFFHGLDECFRVARPDGRIVLMLPNDMGFGRNHVWRITLPGVQRLLEILKRRGEASLWIDRDGVAKSILVWMDVGEKKRKENKND